MNPAIDMFIPRQAKEMKRVRVFVKGVYNRYGECSEKSLHNARKHHTHVKVTFSKLEMKGREVIATKHIDEVYIPVNHIK